MHVMTAAEAEVAQGRVTQTATGVPPTCYRPTWELQPGASDCPLHEARQAISNLPFWCPR